MSDKKIIQFLNLEFRKTSRPKREKILCAMIRINYGTPWRGDNQLLKDFFPTTFHKNLAFGGLTEIIGQVSPFADEPTISGAPTDETTLKDLEITASLPTLTREINPSTFENTSTQKLPLAR